jgi:ribA/ribD-fused uncharacterized protein
MNEKVTYSPGIIDVFSTKTENGWVHSYLSNGYIEPDGSFVEREYQACKTLDPEYAAQVLACTKPFGPGGAKQTGTAAPLRTDWEEVKFQVMAHFVLQKFLDHPELAQRLLATEDNLIVEGNSWHDNTWGDCHCGRKECTVTGRNWLGHILMSTREALRHIR